MQNLQVLAAIYLNSQSREELDIALERFGLSFEELQKVAYKEGFKPGPAVLAYDPEPGPVKFADEDYIKNANKAAVRQKQQMLQVATVLIGEELRDMDALRRVQVLEKLASVQDKLTRLEFHIHGIIGSDSVPPSPIVIDLSEGNESKA